MVSKSQLTDYFILITYLQNKIKKVPKPKRQNQQFHRLGTSPLYSSSSSLVSSPVLPDVTIYKPSHPISMGRRLARDVVA